MWLSEGAATGMWWVGPWDGRCRCRGWSSFSSLVLKWPDGRGGSWTGKPLGWLSEVAAAGEWVKKNRGRKAVVNVAVWDVRGLEGSDIEVGSRWCRL